MLPLVPWFAIAAASGLFTAWAEAKFIGAEGAEFSFSLLQRVLLAGRVLVFYAAHVAWPTRLMFIYPRWDLSAGGLWPWLCLFGVGAVLAAAWAASRGWRGSLAGLLFVVGTLFPALGFVNVYPFRFSFVADHFQYLASLGLILPASWAIAMLIRSSGLGAAARAALLLALPAVLGVLSWRQARVYRDAQTLYRSAIAANPDAWLMHYNLAVTLGMGPAHLGEAISEYRATVRLKPDHWEAHNNLASALLKQPGGSAEAIVEYREALRYNPDYSEAENNLGIALRDEPGRRGEAEAHLRAAIRLRPDYDAAHSNLGALLLHKPGSAGRGGDRVSGGGPAGARNGRLSLQPGERAGPRAGAPRDEAIAEYRAALGLKPRVRRGPQQPGRGARPEAGPRRRGDRRMPRGPAPRPRQRTNPPEPGQHAGQDAGAKEPKRRGNTWPPPDQIPTTPRPIYGLGLLLAGGTRPRCGRNRRV